MRDKHRARRRRGGRPDPEWAFVDVEAWGNESAARLNRSPVHAARMALWRLKCWLLRNGWVASIS